MEIFNFNIMELKKMQAIKASKAPIVTKLSKSFLHDFKWGFNEVTN